MTLRHVILKKLDTHRPLLPLPPEANQDDSRDDDANAGSHPCVINPLLVDTFARLMAHPSLLTPDEATLAVCREWDRFSVTLCQAYQDQALAEVGCPEARVGDFGERLAAAP